MNSRVVHCPPLRRFEPKKFCHWLWKYSTTKRYVLQHRRHREKRQKRKKEKKNTNLLRTIELGRQQFEFTDIQIQGKRVASNVKDQKTLVTMTNLTATFFVDRHFVAVILNRTVHPKMKLLSFKTPHTKNDS